MTILVVGGGKMGLSHLAILARIATQSEVALCDSSRVMRFIFARFKFKTFATLDAALGSPMRWTGAVIATPTTSHFAITRTLLERKIPCFVEKPLTLNPAQSQELVELRKRQRVVAQMGLVARFIAAFVRVRWAVQSGVLGRPLRYQARMLGNVITRPDNNGWRTVYAKGGGCLNEYGPHLIDLCRYFFGNVSEIQNATMRKVFSTEADDGVSASWVHESGCLGELVLDWCDATKRKATLAFDIEFEKGTLHATNTDVEVSVKDGFEVEPGLLAQLQAPVLPHPVNYYLRGEEYSLQLEVFLGSVTGQQLVRGDDLPADTAATLEDGLAADRLIRDIATRVGLA